MALRDIVPWSKGEGGMLGRYEPFAMLSDLQREVNQLFEHFPRGLLGLGRDTGEFMPAVDVKERDDAVDVMAELPGLTDKEVEVTLSPTGDALILRGEKKQESEKEEKGYYRRECTWGTFERTIALPATVEEDKIEATFKNGVLMVHLPKAPTAKQSTKIPIKKAD